MTASDTERALLRMLARGDDFTVACRELGDAGVRAAWQCILHGWIDRGQITEAGREVIAKPAPWNGTIVVGGKPS